jgi:hypothetical protein
MRRQYLVRHRIAASIVLAALTVSVAQTQELNGSFTANSTGENFNIQGNGDGTADIYGSDGRHVGTAEDNGDGTWDIQTSGGRNIGHIEDNGGGSIEVYGSEGGHWGSGNSDE